MTNTSYASAPLAGGLPGRESTDEPDAPPMGATSVEAATLSPVEVMESRGAGVNRGVAKQVNASAIGRGALQVRVLPLRNNSKWGGQI